MLGRLGSPLGGGKANEVHVVSYNVLSSSLASPGYFQHCRAENLHAEKRYKKLTLKLEEQVKRSAVICLQEVSTAWAGQLHSFFQKEDYYLISSHYTKQWQGYMGSAIAFPTTRFTAEEVEVVRVADTKSWPKRPKPTMFGKLSTAVQDLFFGPKRNEDHYDLARNRQNTMVLCKLKCRTSGKKICVGTYHMPCMFWAPKVRQNHPSRLSPPAPALCGGCGHGGGWLNLPLPPPPSASEGDGDPLCAGLPEDSVLLQGRGHRALR